MAKIRLQVTVNGRNLCIAGMDEHGTLTAAVELTQVPGAPDPFRPSHHPPDEECYQLRIEGEAWAGDSLRWVAETVQAGDEITIRVLDAGPSDAPGERISGEPF
jgi:hypothetical protein